MSRDSGWHKDVPMEEYLSLPALGSTHLECMNVSPRFYRWTMDQGPIQGETSAQRLGTAAHMAILEPDLFKVKYAIEPVPAECSPEASKPRATKAYKDAVQALESKGVTVLRAEDFGRVAAIQKAVLTHPAAAKALAAAPERELTALWRHPRAGSDGNGRLCRARFDAMGKGVAVDLKTTRSLAKFNPYVISARGYYRSAGWYEYGADVLGRQIKHYVIIALENTPPYDVGVFVVDEEVRRIGREEYFRLIDKLTECEDSGVWPGMFPEIQQVVLTDAVAFAAMGLED